MSNLKSQHKNRNKSKFLNSYCNTLKQSYDGIRLHPRVPIDRVRKVLLAAILASTNIDLRNEATRYFNWFDNQVTHRGLEGGLHRHKLVHHTAINFALGQKNPGHAFLSVDISGFPKCIKYLKKYTKTPQGIQAINSLLAYYRIIKLPANPDFSSITKDGPMVSEILIDELTSNIDWDWKFNPSELKAPKVVYRSKKGPNGHATFSCAEDLKALLNEPELYEALQNYLEEANGDEILDDMESLEEDLIDNANVKHSLISVKREGGGKSRPFAIIDYWSQTALKPLHDFIFGLLKRIPQDCTFDQDRCIPIIRSWTQSGDKDIHCFDLRAATDRWSLIYQKHLLARMSDNLAFADAWASVMAKRHFHYKRSTYQWQVGQPLGALSSWGMFTLSHHQVMKIAYKRALIIDPSTKLSYFILGDDVIIKGNLLASIYLEIVTDLGVEIQLLKSVSGSAAEFTKRHFIKGTEVSAIPINLIASTVKSPLLINMLHESLAKRASITLIRRDFLYAVIDVVGRNPQEIDNLRTIVSNPITGKRLYDARRTWGTDDGARITQSEYNQLYAITKYKYLVQQYSLLQNGQESFMSKLNKVVLPGIKPDHHIKHRVGAHPYSVTLTTKYADSMSASHKSLGKFWSERKLSRDNLPKIPQLSERILTASKRQQFKHSAKIILLFHKKVKTLIERTNKDFIKRRNNLICKSILSERALYRNLRVRNNTRLGAESLSEVRN